MALEIGSLNPGALAIFSGGLGIGLQKVFSKLLSGVNILLEKSISPGDVIEIERAYRCTPPTPAREPPGNPAEKQGLLSNAQGV